MSIWDACHKNFKPQIIKQNCWRLVELQALSSTRALVTSSKAHDRLEEILDGGKPEVQLLAEEKKCASLHYLLLTPFRYPPLRFGSRFGTVFERGIFYASSNVHTAATEKAFYRIFFARGTTANVGGKHITYTSFQAKINTAQGADLTKAPFGGFRPQISSKTSYQATQALGGHLRAAGVQAFITPSARVKEPSTNLNAFSPLAFDPKHSISSTFEEWVCFYTKQRAELYPKKDPIKSRLVFKDKDFAVNGAFPHPPA